MPTLERADLLEACREIYRMAGDDFMLPPLIRTAKSEAGSGHTFYSLTDTHCVRFIVEFDKAFVDEKKFPLSRLPLRFKAELCDIDFEEPPVPLEKHELRELVRAFFLGAKAPILAEKSPLAPQFKLRVQLSSAFFVECGELANDSGDPTLESICRLVGGRLYDRSKDFLTASAANPWEIRAAQELFGEPKPDAEFFWPPGAEDAAPLPAEAPPSPPAVANALLFIGPNFAPPLVAPPVFFAPLMARRTGDLTITKRRFAFPAAAAMVVAAAGLAGALALRSGTAAPPRGPLIGALVSEPFVPPPPDKRAEAETSTPSMIAAVSLVALAAAATPPAAQLEQGGPECDKTSEEIKLGAVPVKAAAKPALRPDAKRIAAHRTGRRESGPFTTVGRAADALASGVVKNLKRLPNRLANLISGR